jgi:hypothetical protein
MRDRPQLAKVISLWRLSIWIADCSAKPPKEPFAHGRLEFVFVLRIGRESAEDSLARHANNDLVSGFSCFIRR